jgi:hypothetical protein
MLDGVVLTPLKVRIGTPADVDDFMDLALMGAHENGFAPPDPVKILKDVWAALHCDHGITGVIEGPQRRLEGAVLLRIGDPWYTRQLVLEERAIYIHPDYRGAKGGRAARLCEFTKFIADQLGIPLMIGVLSNTRTEAKVRMYRRIFGEPAGAYFLYHAHTGGAVEAPTTG